MSFIWTGTGQSALRLAPVKSVDFSIKQDGERRWVYYHWRYKSAVAIFTGENATQALKALKMALITHRMTS